MLYEVLPIEIDRLLGEAAGLKTAGYRFVIITCTALDANQFDLLYHFDRNLELRHLRLTLDAGRDGPSISPIYFAAFLAENEIQDLFGIRFTGLAVDYQRTLYGEESTRITPFCKYTVVAPPRANEQPESEPGTMRTQEEA